MVVLDVSGLSLLFSWAHGVGDAAEHLLVVPTRAHAMSVQTTVGCPHRLMLLMVSFGIVLAELGVARHLKLLSKIKLLFSL